MKRIPVEATLGGAYRFLFTNIVSVIGTVWFPFVLFFGLCGGLFYLSVPHEWLSGNFPHPKSLRDAIAAMMPLLRIYPACLLLMLLMVAMVFTGLMRHALGLKTTTTFVYFSLGAPVWRMIGAYLLVWVVEVILIAVLAVLFCAVWKFAVPTIPHGAGIALLVVLGTIEVLLAIYAAVRLSFFIPAVVVAENRIGLGRAWSLGGGNFWRIIIVVLLTTIPVAVVFNIVLQMTVMPAVMAEAMKLAPAAKSAHHVNPEQIAAFLHALLPVLPVFLAVALVQRLAIIGLLSGAIGKAYNAVTAPDAPAE
ncbi:MAG: hypothetical protein KGM97_02695 [Alphaproteobacteria bacterium]|nr:hypothetical protein [Alphaproteobacteria bacterium]MDE2629878.1 hypothetical protein [Alphaproteobacteria bacterium]